jgi:adenylate cyclase
MGSARLCRACGLGLRRGARFCDGCGAPVSGDSDFAEYKQVTVMFADVVGSMRIASALGGGRIRSAGRGGRRYGVARDCLGDQQ